MTFKHISNRLQQAIRLSRFGILILFIPTILSSALAEEPEYISTRDLAERFDLQERPISDETVRLTSKTVSMQLTALKNDCELNSLTLTLIHPVTRSEETLMVSRTDVEQMLTPILKPDQLNIREPIRLLLVVEKGKDPRSDLPEEVAKTKWVDMIVEALGENMARRRNSIAVRRITGGDLRKALSELKPEDREGTVLLSMHCEGRPENPITAETFAPKPQPSAKEGKAEITNQPSFDSIALAAAVQGSIGRQLGEHLRNGRIGQAQLPDMAGLGFPAVRLVFSPPDAAGKDQETIRPYAKAFAMGVTQGIVRFDIARTN